MLRVLLVIYALKCSYVLSAPCPLWQVVCPHLLLTAEISVFLYISECVLSFVQFMVRICICMHMFYFFLHPCSSSKKQFSFSVCFCEALLVLNSEFPWLSPSCFDKWKFLRLLSGLSTHGTPPSILTPLSPVDLESTLAANGLSKFTS